MNEHGLIIIFSVIFLLCLVSTPVLGTTPSDLIPCGADFLWSSETYDVGGVGQYTVWTTFLSIGASLEIVMASNEITSVTLTFPDGSRTEFSIIPPSTKITSSEFDKDGKLIRSRELEETWEKILFAGICEEEWNVLTDLLRLPPVIISPEGGDFSTGIGGVAHQEKIIGLQAQEYPPGLDDFPCSITWSKKQLKTGSGQYTQWTTVLPDGSTVILVSGPHGVKGITISEPNGTVIYITFPLYPGDTTHIRINTFGDSTEVETDVPPEFLLEELLCNRDGDNVLDTWYEFLNTGVRKTFKNGDRIEVPLGDETVTLTFVDDTGQNTQNGETNADITCEIADLFIKQLTVPDVGTAGTQVQVSATVVNTGSFPSGEIPVGVHLSQGQNMLYPLEKIPSLQPGESRDITFTITVPDDTEGIGILTLILDPDNAEDECNENNNEESADFRILPAGVSPKEYTSQTTGAGTKITGGTGSGGGGSGGCCSDCWC